MEKLRSRPAYSIVAVLRSTAPRRVTDVFGAVEEPEDKGCRGWTVTFEQDRKGFLIARAGLEHSFFVADLS
jgi:hypothetical protein